MLCLLKGKLSVNNIPSNIRDVLPLLPSISHVLLMRSKPKMFWIAARLIISTGTIVKNKLTVWNRAFVKNPANPMCSYLGIVRGEQSISRPSVRSSSPSLPQPTRFSFFNLGKKRLNLLWGKSLSFLLSSRKLVLHNISSVDVTATLPVCQNAGAFRFQSLIFPSFSST